MELFLGREYVKIQLKTENLSPLKTSHGQIQQISLNDQCCRLPLKPLNMAEI